MKKLEGWGGGGRESSKLCIPVPKKPIRTTSLSNVQRHIIISKEKEAEGGTKLYFD